MRTVSGLLMIAGAVFALLAGVGVVRFRDTYSRMHAAAKASTLGLVLTALGAALRFGSATTVTLLVLVVVLQLLTTPVGAHMLGSGLHRHVGAVSDHDELADAKAAGAGDGDGDTADTDDAVIADGDTGR
jgi:multicomponent Na+:H+ antiporter subunit G